MVLTQLQLKWPNHSTHLLTGLTSLFKNEQLVDCTLKCNKSTLKVHRSVLAACSPYFERELKNNPLMVIEDMQFAVLRALVEFMYYGETHITEENLKSLIEAAKLFEVKGLSEMDLPTSKESTIISSVVAVNKNYTVESSCISNSNFENNSQIDTTSYKSLMSQAVPNGIAENCLNDGEEDSNSTLIVESSNDDQSHASRNFVITPPQTESAKILLSLGQAHNAGPYSNGPHASDVVVNGALLNGKLVDTSNNIIYDEHHGLVLADLTPPSTSNDADSVQSFSNVDIESQMTQQQHHQQLLQTKQSLNHQNEQDVLKIDYVLPPLDRCIGNTFELPPADGADGPKSLLQRLLTRGGGGGQSSPKCTRYDEQYRTLYEEEDDRNQNKPERSTNTIMDWPLLIETAEGYMDISTVEGMLGVFENGDPLDTTSGGAGARGSVKIIPKDAMVAHDCVAASEAVAATELLDQEMVERIKRDTADELRNDPEAVVLSRLTEDGRLEQYILSSADVRALKESNERRRRTAERFQAASSSSITTEIESSLSDGEAPLITCIVDCGRLENAISKLPLRKSGEGGGGGLDSIASAKRGHDDCVGEHILEEARLAVDSHHHENMFEELDNQFSMEGSIEHIQREYVAYEEASKNETQLEHNYYANAIKDEDEKCSVMGEGYDLRSMAMLEEPLAAVNGDDSLAALDAANGRRKNANVLSTFHAIDPPELFLKGCEGDKMVEQPRRRNGFVDRTSTSAIFNGKCDLDGETLVGVAASTNKPTARAANNSSKNFRTFRIGGGARRSLDSANTLPFKSVKSTSRRGAEKKPRRTYKRKADSVVVAKEENRTNGLPSSASSRLIEEIVVDEIS